MQPGLCLPGTRYEITDLKVGRKERFFGLVDEEAFTLSASATVPDETHDVVVTREVSGENGTARLPAAFLRQWELAEVPLGEIENLLQMVPASLSFEATVSVVIEEPGSPRTRSALPDERTTGVHTLSYFSADHVLGRSWWYG